MIKKIMHNNKGVTLMEMLIVLALIAILSGLAGLSLSMINSSSVDKAAVMLNSSIEKGRYAAMAKGAAHGTINVTKAGETNIRIDGVKEEMLANSSVQVWFSASTAVVENTGAMTPFTSTDITFKSNGMVDTIFGAPASPARIYEIAFKKGKKVSAVVIYPATGKTKTIGWYE